jgi:hypothetical protein
VGEGAVAGLAGVLHAGIMLTYVGDAVIADLEWPGSRHVARGQPLFSLG